MKNWFKYFTVVAHECIQLFQGVNCRPFMTRTYWFVDNLTGIRHGHAGGIPLPP